MTFSGHRVIDCVNLECLCDPYVMTCHSDIDHFYIHLATGQYCAVLFSRFDRTLNGK